MKKPSLSYKPRTKNSVSTNKKSIGTFFSAFGKKTASGRSSYARGQKLLSDKSVNRRSFVKKQDARMLNLPKTSAHSSRGAAGRGFSFKAFFSGFFGNFAVANKKRFSIVVSVVAVAIAVPIVAVSANGSGNADRAVQQPPAQQAEGGQLTESQTGGGQDSLVAEGMNVDMSGAGGETQVPDGMQAYGTENGAVDGGENGASSGESQAGGETPVQEGADQPSMESGGETDANEAGGQGESIQQMAEPEPQYMDLEPEGHSDDVVKLQQRLMELHYMDNDEPTDYYGQNTQEAVRYFQRKHNLEIDAYAGEATQDLLFSDEAMPYSVTEGASGLDVENIQNRLEELGYPTAGTGYFGDKTTEAVEYFQRMNGLDDDGSVGQYTKEILFSQEAEPSIAFTEEAEREVEASESDGDSGDGGGDSSSDDDDDDDGGSGGGDGGGSYSSNPGDVDTFVDVALSQLGKPYVRGGKGSGSFDCSGLVYYALNQSGNSIGYMTSSGWRSADFYTVGSIGELQRGDVICFTGHVGIYLGGGEMVDASSSNGSVVRRGLGSWAHSNFICGKRPI